MPCARIQEEEHKKQAEGLCSEAFFAGSGCARVFAEGAVLFRHRSVIWMR